MLLRSIRSQLLGLVLATVIPFAALIGIGLFIQWKRDHAAAIERARTEARLLAAQVDDYLGNLENLLTGLSRAISPNLDDLKSNDALLQRVHNELPPFVSNLLLFAPDGTNIGTAAPNHVRRDVGHREYFRQIVEGQRTSISELIRARSTDEWIVAVARRVDDESGRLRAVISVGTKLELFQEALRMAGLPEGSVISIINERGVVIARNVDGASWIGRDLSKSPAVMRHVAARDISEVMLWPDGVERITGSASVHSAPWLVSVGLPQDVVFAPAARRLAWGALMITAALLAGIVIAWLLSGRIVRPLRQLSHDASVLAGGNLSHRSAVDTDDEVGALAKNFNCMAQSLERRHAEASGTADELREAKDMLAAVIDASPAAIVCSNNKRNISLWSRGAEKLFGYSADEVLGGRSKVIPAEYAAEAQAMFDRVFFNGELIRDVQTIRRRKDGSLVDVRIAASPTYNLDGSVRDVALVYEDITDRRRAEEQLRRLAHYDQLTGLPNRLSLQKELGRLLAGDCKGRPTSIALFDLDGFKDVNDTLGHSTGDELLVEVGHRLIELAENHSEVGLVCRLGGDEFVVIVPDCGDPTVVSKIVDTIIKKIAEPFTINEQALHIGASAGVAIAPNDGRTVDELIANADLALYQAKSDGGRVCRFFLPVLRAQAQARRALDLELRRAFAQQEFELHYQPQIRLTDGAVVGAEALIRWRHPVRGILAPGAFIETLGDSAIAPDVGRWIVATACSQAAQWRAKGLPLSRIAVNLFPSQAHDPALVQDVEDALRETGLPAAALELEITEYAAFNYEDPHGPLQQLQEKGVLLAFDDFGTGYASLSYLTRFPVSRIKIDRSFIGKITDDAEDAAIVRSLIAMAHNLELEVIAEGVETEAQATLLINEGCHEAQGYLYAKPLPGAEFEAYLQARRVTLEDDKIEKRVPRSRNLARRTGGSLARRRFPRT